MFRGFFDPFPSVADSPFGLLVRAAPKLTLGHNTVTRTDGLVFATKLASQGAGVHTTMKKEAMNLKPLALAIALTASVGAQAAQFDFQGDIVTHKDVIQINFSLLADATDVKVWTDSFQSGINFDPITAVWKQTNTGWNLVGENDDEAGIAPGQTYFDSGLTFGNLSAGNYLFTIATFNNFANGTTLAQGFMFDNQVAIPLAQWNQPSNGLNKGTHYSVHLSGVDGAVSAVPEPESFAMLLAGLGIVGALARRKNRKNAVAA